MSVIVVDSGTYTPEDLQNAFGMSKDAAQSLMRKAGGGASITGLALRRYVEATSVPPTVGPAELNG